MRLSPSDLIPSARLAIRPFVTRDGETWFALHATEFDGELLPDGLVAVFPTEAEAELRRAGKLPPPVAPLVLEACGVEGL